MKIKLNFIPRITITLDLILSSLCFDGLIKYTQKIFFIDMDSNILFKMIAKLYDKGDDFNFSIGNFPYL